MADSAVWFHSKRRKVGDGFLWKGSECLLEVLFGVLIHTITLNICDCLPVSLS